MWRKPERGLFVTGTCTGVGKTYVASLIARALRAAGHRVGVYKPAASGCRRDDQGLVAEDALALWEAAGRPGPLHEVCPQCFEAPLAPHLAARAEQRELDVRQLRSGLVCWSGRCDLVLVEGAGGLMSPLGDEQYNADLAAELGYPLIVVAANRLGVINQTLQTLMAAAARDDDLPVAGVVLNDVLPSWEHDPSVDSNWHELQSRCEAPMLAHVAWRATSLGDVDWYRLASR